MFLPVGPRRSPYMLAKTGRLVFAFLLAVLSISTAGATDIRAGTLDAPFFAMIFADGRPEGLYPRILQKLAKHSGLTIDVQLVPLPRLISMLADGDLDIGILLQNETVAENATMVGEVLQLNPVIYPATGRTFSNWTDLNGLTIARIRGSMYGRKFDEDGNIEKFDTNSYETNLKMMQQDHVDGGIGIDLSYLYQAKIMKIPKENLGRALIIKRIPTIIYYSNHAMDKTKFEKLRKSLADMVAADDPQRIVDDFLEQ